MIDIKAWVDQFLGELGATFGDRVWFVGLQGSYGRGEATEKSDIDMVVILDDLSTGDIVAYREMLDKLPHRDLTCGFLAGKRELFSWEPFDLVSLYYDTTPILGSMDEILDMIDRDAIKRAVRVGACNIYHGCVHNMLHGKNEKMIIGLYKQAIFVAEALYLAESGRYYRCLKDLLAVAEGKDREIIETYVSLKRGGEVRFFEMSRLLIEWVRGLI